MKKLILIIFAFLFLENSDAQNTCSSSTTLNNLDTFLLNQTFQGTEHWYKFIPDSAINIVSVKNLSANKIEKIEIYQGNNCGDLILVDTCLAYGDSILYQSVDFTNTATFCYLKLIKSNNLSVLFDLSLKAPASGGAFFSLFLCSNGTVKGSGWNNYGAIGNGNNLNTNLAVNVANLTGVVSESAGAYHSLFLLNNGTVWASGPNFVGELGNGTFISSTVPVQVSGLTNVIKISAGNGFSLALKSNGTVWAWGFGASGQLGVGTTTNTNVPVQVSSLSNIINISAGEQHALALRNDGTVWAWGYNGNGQLGDNTFVNRLTPVQEFNGFANIKQISAGGEHSLILSNTGNIYASGNNNVGQFGNGTFINSQKFILSSNCPSNIIDIAAGGDFSIALRNDRTVWAWGYNGDGACGNGNPMISTLVTQVPGLNCINSISTGAIHSLAVKSDGTTWGWGYNFYGALANGNNITQFFPIQINTGCTAMQTPLNVTGINPICSGSSTTLTASSSVNCTWSPINGLNQSIGSTVIASPAATTTYTVTDGCGQSGQFLVNILPLPAAPTINGVSTTCNQDNELYTITNYNSAYVYSVIIFPISAGIASSINSTGQFTVNWNTTNNASIVVSNTDASGCTNSSTFPVAACPPQCAVTLNRDIANGTFLSSLWPANSMVTAQNIRITGTVYADVNVTFANCNIIMQPNAKIQLQNSTILKLTEKTHVYSCTELWDGIYASTTTQKITVEQNAFIEDAQNAIVSENGGQYDLSMCIFNKNKIGLDVRAYTNNSGSNYPGIVRKTLFTTRNIPSNQVPSSNLTMASILSNITSYPISNTKVPYQYQKGIYGVNITDVIGSFGINIGYAGLMPDGTSATNYFEGIHVGVNATRSTFKVYNNNFQNLVHASSTCIGCMNPVGTGVKAKGTNTGTYAAVVGFSGSYNNNTFYNCHRAVEISEYKSSYVGFNTIGNSVTASGLTPGYGNGGIYVLKPAAANSINIQYNNVNNCATGIWTGYNFSSYSVDTYTLQINNNTISANSNGFCTNGIYINALSTATFTTPATSEIKDNSITQATNGISISNFKKIINIKINSISNRYAASGSINGIKLTGCQNLVVENNHTNYDVATASLINGNLAAYGIYLQNSTNMIVKCNTIEKAARSMVFEGTCTSSTTAGFGITCNTMIKAQDGFVLKGSGIIGQQGDANTIKSDNVWDLTAGNYFTTSQTNVELGSDANLSKLYVTNLTSGLVTRPVLNSGGGSQYFWSTSLLSSTGTAAVCGFVPAALMAGGNENLSMSSSSSSNYSNELKAIEQDNTQFPVYNDESHWQRDKFVYDELVRNSNLTTNAALNNFYNNTTNAAIGKFNAVEKKMAIGNYIVANTINNSINPTNLPEQNQKTMNSLILNQAINASYVYTSSDIATATAIAEQCPLQGGNAVYQARNLLMIINNDVIEFVDNCDAGVRTMLTNENTTAAFDDQSFKLYPNPNDGNMVLSYSLAEKSEGTFNLYDITGRLINHYTLLVGENNSLKITESNLTSGVYFYSIVINEEIKTYNKIVITK